jgi:uncharacterized Tic20 family protein
MNPNPGFHQAPDAGQPQPGYGQSQPGYGQSQPGYGPPPGYPPQYPPNPNNDRALAAVAHWAPAVLALLFSFLVPLLGALTPWIPPLVVFTASRSVFVKEHARESLNFQLTALFPLVVCAVLNMLLSFGWVFSLVLILGCLVMQIMGVVKASEGQWFRYPVSIRLIPPPGQPAPWAPPPANPLV